MAAKYVNCPSCNYVRCRNPKGCCSCPLWYEEKGLLIRNLYVKLPDSVDGGVK